MDSSNYSTLYQLQDEVLSTIFSESSGFYLTGGTALSRFYLNHRYSDDLDFFTHDTTVFPDSFRLLFGKIIGTWDEVSLEVDARDFKRVRIKSGQTVLKLDFVSDRVPRIGLPMKLRGLYIDTVRNILSNKLCAILGRDEGRDIADLIYISRQRRFSWKDLLADTIKKEGFQLEELVFRLDSFPLEALASVPFIKKQPLVEYAKSLSAIRYDIMNQGENTLSNAASLDLEWETNSF